DRGGGAAHGGARKAAGRAGGAVRPAGDPAGAGAGSRRPGTGGGGPARRGAERGGAPGVRGGAWRAGGPGRPGGAGGCLRCPAGHLRGGQGPVPRQPVGSGGERRGRLTAHRRVDHGGGAGCGVGVRTDHVGERPRGAVRPPGPGARVAQVDDDSAAIGAHRPVDIGVHGDVAQTARVVLACVHTQPGYRSGDVRDRIAREVRWRDVPYDDQGGDGVIDPRTLTIALDDLLPAERVVAIDSGNFMGYPSMFLSVPDENGFCFTQAYQSIGLGLASAIGAALAQPDRLPVAALGDGGALMGISELETVVRLRLAMVLVGYDDEACAAEVPHFGRDGFARARARFPPADIAAIGRGFGCAGVTVRGPGDLGPVREWLAGPRDRPLVIDAKVASASGSWWLEEAFRGH